MDGLWMIVQMAMLSNNETNQNSVMMIIIMIMKTEFQRQNYTLKLLYMLGISEMYPFNNFKSV